ncbi:MAG: hypothetical protein KDC87_18130 [Planctomycetes bacterium]|nr:hypothetical protein [Planctomycetota bacterium]
MTARWVRPELLLAVALATSIGLRLLNLAQLAHEILFTSPMVDALEYLEEARQRAAGTYSYRVPAHGPLYPILLGLAYRACAGDPFWLHGLSAMVGPGTCAVLYVLGKGTFGRWPAAIAAALFAVYRPGLLYECDYYAAGLANLLVTATVLLLAATRAGPRWLHTIGLGTCLAGAALTRANLLVLAPLVITVLATRQNGRRHAAVVLALLIGAIAPFSLANHRASGEWILLQGRGAENLYMANHRGSDGTVDIRPGPEFEQVRRRPALEAGAFDPGAESRFFTDLVWRFARDNPGELAALVLRKAWNSMSPVEAPSSYHNEGHRAASAVLRLWLPGFGWLLPLVCVGALASSRRFEGRVVLAAVALVWLTLLVFFPTGRYRYPVAGLSCLLAANGLSALAAARRGGPRSGVLIAFGLGALLVSTAPRFTAQRGRWQAEYVQLKAYAHLFARNLTAARACATEGARRDTSYAWPHYTLGLLALHGTDGRPGTAGARFRDAIEHFTAAVERLPAFPDAYHNRAIAHFQLREFRAAARDFQHTVALVPYHAAAWEYLAQSHAALGENDAARRCRARAEAERARIAVRRGVPR